jgi:hypothetical protein
MAEKEEKEPIYTRKVFVNRVLRNRSIKESEMTREDFDYFFRKLAEVYNASPVGVKRLLFEEIAPSMIQLMNDEEVISQAKASMVIAKGLGGDTKTVN